MVLCANQDNKKSITAGYASIKVDLGPLHVKSQ